MTDQRKYKRFELRLPLELLRSGNLAASETCETRNLSSGGVLFHSTLPIEVGDLIEYRITLPPNSPSESPVLLHCKGKVVRRQLTNGGSASNIAATLERYEFVRNK